MQTLQHSVISILQQLYTRRITNPKQVFELIYISPIDDHEEIPRVGPAGFNDEEELDVPCNGLQLRALGQLLMMHLKRYFEGTGHPKQSIYDDLIAPKDRDAADADPAFRARQFLSQMTGTSFVPLSAEKLQASHSLPFRKCINGDIF